MADWDEDSEQLSRNLTEVLLKIRPDAERRAPLTLETARQWQRDTMKGLEVPSSEYVGKFRGEEGVTNVRVRIGASEGVDPTEVATELQAFEERLQRVLNALDQFYPLFIEAGRISLAGSRQTVEGFTAPDLDADGLAAVIDLAAWAHSEWVRIHPFANGNGRTARMWANAIFMRYGLPPVVRLRPRPNAGYGFAAARAMKRDWQPTAILFRNMLKDEVS